MNIQIDSAVKRGRAYWFVDGFVEMVIGGFFVVLAGLILFGKSASPETFSAWFLSLAAEVSVVKLVGILVAVAVLWWLKDHFTYPRTGFVRGRKVTVALILVILRNIVIFLLLPIVALLAASLLMTSAGSVVSSMPVWFPIALGFLWAILLWLAADWTGLRHFRWISSGVLLAGVLTGIWEYALGLSSLPPKVQPTLSQPAVVESINRTLTGLSVLVLITGVILSLSGLLIFLRYRKENPAPYAEDA